LAGVIKHSVSYSKPFVVAYQESPSVMMDLVYSPAKSKERLLLILVGSEKSIEPEDSSH